MAVGEGRVWGGAIGGTGGVDGDGPGHLRCTTTAGLRPRRRWVIGRQKRREIICKLFLKKMVT
jgi:hypothetical protein